MRSSTSDNGRHTVARKLKNTAAILAGIAVLVTFGGTRTKAQTETTRKPFQPKAKTSFEFGYLGEYESNLYHVYADTAEKSSMLNGIYGNVDWKYKASRRVTHRATAYADLGLYAASKYSDRNTYSFGLKYEPDFHPNKNIEIAPHVEISRRSKNVIDDISPDPTRTLKKTQLDAGVTTRFDVGKGRLDVSGGYQNNNYDESDTVLAGGTTQPLTSWDYHEWQWGAEFRQPFARTVVARVEYSLDKRSYRERYQWVSGGQIQLRRFTYSSVGGHIVWEFVTNNSIDLNVKYTLRKDSRNDTRNNFYGYTFWQYGAEIDLAPSARFTVNAAFEVKSKDYPNYYTSRIGIMNRVKIDYTDFSIEPAYKLSDVVAVVGYLRNYDKTSNDPLFDYHDLFVGAGFRLNW